MRHATPQRSTMQSPLWTNKLCDENRARTIRAWAANFERLRLVFSFLLSCNFRRCEKLMGKMGREKRFGLCVSERVCVRVFRLSQRKAHSTTWHIKHTIYGQINTYHKLCHLCWCASSFARAMPSAVASLSEQNGTQNKKRRNEGSQWQFMHRRGVNLRHNKQYTKHDAGTNGTHLCVLCSHNNNGIFIIIHMIRCSKCTPAPRTHTFSLSQREGGREVTGEWHAPMHGALKVLQNRTGFRLCFFFSRFFFFSFFLGSVRTIANSTHARARTNVM